MPLKISSLFYHILFSAMIMTSVKAPAAHNDIIELGIVQEATFHAASPQGKYRESILPGRVISAKVIRKISSAPCQRNESFGVRGNILWVDRGCRADFQVKYLVSGIEGGLELLCEG